MCSLHKDGIRKTISVHKLIAITFLNYIPNKNIEINHIDGNKINNKLSNLEIVTHRENLSICYRKNKDKISSQYPGVSWDKQNKKWRSQINKNGKRIQLGLFENELEAFNKCSTEKLNYHYG